MGLNGVASSRASVHNIRPHVTYPPGIVTMRSRRKMTRRPVAPDWELVACKYTAARGSSGIGEFKTSSREVIA